MVAIYKLFDYSKNVLQGIIILVKIYSFYLGDEMLFMLENSWKVF